MKYYIVNGKPRSGKDTFVDEVIRLMRSKGILADKISTVDFVKEAALILGWDGNKDEKGRKFLSDLKDLSSSVYNHPFNIVQKEISDHPKCTFFFFIREPEEIQKLINAYPIGTFETICVVGRLSEKEKISNHADKHVDKYIYDNYIYNLTSIGNLLESSKEFYECVVKKNIQTIDNLEDLKKENIMLRENLKEAEEKLNYLERKKEF